jgi:hypothetical protein
VQYIETISIPIRKLNKQKKTETETESETETNGMPLPKKILDFARCKSFILINTN